MLGGVVVSVASQGKVTLECLCSFIYCTLDYFKADDVLNSRKSHFRYANNRADCHFVLLPFSDLYF
jgi:hypothetical protein